MFVLSIQGFSQYNKAILGAWRKVAETTYADSSFINNEKSTSYLRYEFKNRASLTISSHYSQNASNSPSIDYVIDKDILTFGFNRRFLIAEATAEKLVLVDLEGGLNSSSPKYHFIPEQVYLDNLELNPKDIVLMGGDTAYLTSEKLLPKFKTINPDFHQFVSMRMNDSYEKGENYTLAILTIHPNKEIRDIQIMHHVNKATDKKFIAAIKKTKSMWSLPKLNGRDVPIILSVEDRDFGGRSFDISQPLRMTPLTFERYTDDYLKNFNLAVKAYLRKDYSEALKFLRKCEGIGPQEPNIFYFRYLCFSESSNHEMANKNLKLVKESHLKYLVE